MRKTQDNRWQTIVRPNPPGLSNAHSVCGVMCLVCGFEIEKSNPPHPDLLQAQTGNQWTPMRYIFRTGTQQMKKDMEAHVNLKHPITERGQHD